MGLADMTAGSSPRVRGKHRGIPDHIPHPRLIPARAGKTDRIPDWLDDTRAHPRACGENGLSLGLGFRGSGSSPRVRGKHSSKGHWRDARGLIPARAGKTC